MAQITKEARPKAEGVGRTRGRKIKGERQGKGKILRATHNKRTISIVDIGPLSQSPLFILGIISVTAR